ncbi:HAD family hydrolase [Paenibacillus sp. y28]|uniref:HAD family hydrolase n=1 Tax=Paenibacillus sp. y28 TaxID=3129110 RepID=UPI00301990D5
MLKAIIFDFDGTIIDTETAWYVAFRDAYKTYDVDLTLEMYSQCIGTSLHTFNPYEYLITELNLPIDREQFKSFIHKQHDLLMEKEQIRPGIRSYLDQAKAAGLKIGLASSSSRAWVDKYLAQLDLDRYFDCIRTADNVQRVKPDPELYLQALQCLGVDANEAIAVEDSPNGAKAAEAAGMDCIIIPNGITKHLPFGKSRFRLDALSDLDFEMMLETAAGR